MPQTPSRRHRCSAARTHAFDPARNHRRPDPLLHRQARTVPQTKDKTNRSTRPARSDPAAPDSQAIAAGRNESIRSLDHPPYSKLFSYPDSPEKQTALILRLHVSHHTQRTVSPPSKWCTDITRIFLEHCGQTLTFHSIVKGSGKRLAADFRTAPDLIFLMGLSSVSISIRGRSSKKCSWSFPIFNSHRRHRCWTAAHNPAAKAQASVPAATPCARSISNPRLPWAFTRVRDKTDKYTSRTA
jgi:hypothetical protein